MDYLITLIHNLAAGITNRISTLEIGSTTTATQIASLQTKISSLEDRLAEVNSEISQLSTELAKLKTHAITDSLEEGGAK